jgi:hypothetical protein
LVIKTLDPCPYPIAGSGSVFGFNESGFTTLHETKGRVVPQVRVYCIPEADPEPPAVTSFYVSVPIWSRLKNLFGTFFSLARRNYYKKLDMVNNDTKSKGILCVFCIRIRIK